LGIKSSADVENDEKYAADKKIRVVDVVAEKDPSMQKIG